MILKADLRILKTIQESISTIFINFPSVSLYLYRSGTPMRMYSWEFSENFQNSFFPEQLWKGSVEAQFIKCFHRFKLNQRIYF